MVGWFGGGLMMAVFVVGVVVWLVGWSFCWLVDWLVG